MGICGHILGFRQPWAWTFELRIPTFGLGFAWTCDYIIGDYDFCDRGKRLLRFRPDSVRPRLETVLLSETTNSLWAPLVEFSEWRLQTALLPGLQRHLVRLSDLGHRIPTIT
jgi:hypothetical protein